MNPSRLPRPHLVSAVERQDTHISSVFLAGDWVCKPKKPVDSGFLDFTDLKSRSKFCRQEVELNRRLPDCKTLERLLGEGEIGAGQTRALGRKLAGSYREAMRREAVRASRLEPRMVEEAKQLIAVLGLSAVQTPSEADAQAAAMVRSGDCHAVSSTDYDPLLHGAERLVRKLTGARGNEEQAELIELSRLLE
jgi:aminoglycoside phosphotransferase family enzyme